MKVPASLRTALVWLSLLLLGSYLLNSTRGSVSLLLLSLILVFVVVFAVGAWSARRNLVKIYSYLALGRPDELLALIEPRLAKRRSAELRGPLIVFKAAALSMQGKFDEGLATLKEIKPSELPEPGKKAWQFGYYSAMMSCLLFSERVEEARRIFEDEMEPLAEDETMRGTQRALDAYRAELSFCDGDLDAARPVFERLVGDVTMPPASRAMFHYFLGRIHSEEDRPEDSEKHFELAVHLGRYTWIPAGIEALKAQTA